MTSLQNIDALTVRELRDMLEFLDPDAKVFLVCDYGDYGHTQQALPVMSVEDAETQHLRESAYSQSGLALVDDVDEYDDDEQENEHRDESLPIVILRS